MHACGYIYSINYQLYYYIYLNSVQSRFTSLPDSPVHSGFPLLEEILLGGNKGQLIISVMQRNLPPVQIPAQVRGCGLEKELLDKVMHSFYTACESNPREDSQECVHMCQISGLLESDLSFFYLGAKRRWIQVFNSFHTSCFFFFYIRSTHIYMCIMHIRYICVLCKPIYIYIYTHCGSQIKIKIVNKDTCLVITIY